MGTISLTDFPEIAAALLELPDVVLDCELVMLTADGRPDSMAKVTPKAIDWIERSARTAPACLSAFDLLELEEKDVRTLSLDVRKAMLREVIAKRVDAPYPRGGRSKRLGENQNFTGPAHRRRAREVE